MALNLSHQLGVLAGTPIKSGEMSSPSVDSPLSVSPPSAMMHKAMNLNYKAHGTDPSRNVSPPLSPVLGATRADLSVACKAFAVESAVSGVETVEEQRTYKEGGIGGKKGNGGVPVFVMMPLDSVTMGNTVNRRKAMKASLQALKSAGVEGIMIDVWWGLVERESPGAYNWGGYNELLEMAKKIGLKVQAVMSFHQCGGNVGDSVTYVISLPHLLNRFSNLCIVSILILRIAFLALVCVFVCALDWIYRESMDVLFD